MSDVKHVPAIQGVSIVALGSFNPAILHPRWFADNHMLRDEEAEQAKVEIISGDIAIITTEWFSLQAMQDRFAIETNDPSKYLPLRDLALNTFNVLEHTPIYAFGLNKQQHFEIAKNDAWHAIGHHYAPKNSWEHILEKPGMRTLVVEGKRSGSTADMVQIKIEPSRMVKQGIYIAVNEHYARKGEKGHDKRTADLRTALQSSFDAFLEYSDHAAQHLLNATTND